MKVREVILVHIVFDRFVWEKAMLGGSKFGVTSLPSTSETIPVSRPNLDQTITTFCTLPLERILCLVEASVYVGWDNPRSPTPEQVELFPFPTLILTSCWKICSICDYWCT